MLLDPAVQSQSRQISAEPEAGRVAKASAGPQQSKLTSYISRPVSVARQKRLNGLLLKMIVIDFQPLSIVEDQGFREFVSGLDPSYVIPSKHMLSKKLLPACYEEAVVKIKDTLNTVSDVMLTTGSWTWMTTTNYIAVTAHYITEQFELGSCLLECFQYTERDTAENLKSELLRVVKDWNIEGKIAAVVTDNEAGWI